MVLKKQTVWLLTMLSLVIVLSVYYVTAPNQDQFAVVNEEGKEKESQATGTQDVEVKVEEDGTVASGVSTDDWFTAIRMEIDEERSKLAADLQAVVASADVTAEEKSEALDKIQELHALSTTEDILEQLIRADDSFADALVRADGNQVKVIVKANEHSNQSANEIMRLVRDETGVNQVAVEFQSVQ